MIRCVTLNCFIPQLWRTNYAEDFDVVIIWYLDLIIVSNNYMTVNAGLQI